MIISEDIRKDIRKDIIDELKWDVSLDASKINVEVKEDRIILSGAVSSLAAKKSAERDAGVAGDYPIENKLKVKVPEKITLPSDRELSENITKFIAFTAGFENAHVKAFSEAGIVTLKGTVESYWQKMKAEGLASEMTGVMSIVNEIAVVPTKRVDDESIAEKVVNSMERNLNIDLNQIDVKVVNGIVTLTGKVADWISYDTAYNAAANTAGVIDVINDLAIGT